MISVKIIADSINPYTDDRVTTFELTYPRCIHSEVMTHRLFSRNAQSSRAVPVKTALALLEDNAFFPIEWGKNKSGMSSSEMLSESEALQAANEWREALQNALYSANVLTDIGLHKQWTNRLVEPFSYIKVIVTATEFENFFWLRDDPDAAQPEIVELARQMHRAYNESTPVELRAGFWHIPYVYWEEVNKEQVFFDSFNNKISKEVALKISASCCAQVSYRKLDDSLEKAIDIYNKLFSGPKPHMSPVEHQAMCVNPGSFQDINAGFKVFTHLDRNGNWWSNNLQGFVQLRAEMENPMHCRK